MKLPPEQPQHLSNADTEPMLGNVWPAFRTFTSLPFPTPQHWATVSHPDKAWAAKRFGIISLCFVAVALMSTHFLSLARDSMVREHDISLRR